jgi:hypothetical protein
LLCHSQKNYNPEKSRDPATRSSQTSLANKQEKSRDPGKPVKYEEKNSLNYGPFSQIIFLFAETE